MTCNPQKQPVSRLLPLDGTQNMRDLGGYRTINGRHVRWGVIYRSGHLHNLSDRDIDYLKQLNLSHVVDFRGPSEVKGEPDRIPENVSYISRPVDVAGSDLREKISDAVKGGSSKNLSEYMLNVNYEFASLYTPVFGDWLLHLSRDPGAAPQIFHCTAGKDRTGYAAAVFLRILGVPVEAVFEDYLKTNEYNAAFIEKTIQEIRTRTLYRNNGESLRPLLEVEEQYLQNAFNTINRRWGDFQTYVRDGLGLTDSDVGSLKDRFLE